VPDDPLEDASPSGSRQGSASLGWEQRSSPYTIEGEIEGFQRLGTGVRYARGWKRVVGLALVAMIVVPFVYGVVHFIATLFL
jgi:hypothetical protein